MSIVPPYGTSAQILDLLNKFTIERARKWVAAKTEREVDEIIPQLTQEKLSKRIEQEKLYLLSFLMKSGKMDRELFNLIQF